MCGVQCEWAAHINLCHVLGTVGLSATKPKQEFIRCLYTHRMQARTMLGVAEDCAPPIDLEGMAYDGAQGEAEEVSCTVHGSGVIGEGNVLLFCDGDHDKEVPSGACHDRGMSWLG